MKGIKRVLLSSLLLCLVLTGCGKNVKEETNSVISKAPPTSEAETVAIAESKDSEGYLCGVIYLGYVDYSVADLDTDREYYESIFDAGGYSEEFQFLKEIPASNYVQIENGQELYCIIPTEQAASVSVNRWIVNEDNDFKGEAGEVLYHSEEGSPFLLRCNVSEIIADTEIIVEDHEGNRLRWCPSLSGKDGSVYIGDFDHVLHDFTNYNESAAEATTVTCSVMIGDYYDYYWDENNYEIMAGVRYPIVKPAAKDAEKYPELSKALAENLEVRKDALYEGYESRIELAVEEYAYRSEYFTPYDASETASLRRADSNAFSLLYEGYLYEGGVHGYYYYWGENYDTETGCLLSLNDVVNDIDEFSKLVKAQLDRFWDPDYLYGDLDLETHIKENLDSIAWTLDYHGITLFFNPYEIAPYASGVQIVTVPFAEKPELFAEKYTAAPDSYGMQLNISSPFYYDIDNDGELDEIQVFGMISEDEMYKIHNIYVDDVCYEESDPTEIYAYEIFRPHLIHTQDGRNYLFIENLTDSDMRTTTIYELTSGTPVKIGTVYDSTHATVEEMEDIRVVLYHAITNPYHFLMESRTWVIGTMNGYKTYYMGDDGYPHSYEDYYTFEYRQELTVLKDFTLDIVDEYGIVGGSVTVKRGETIQYYRTDTSMFADFILPNGQIGRADLEWDEGLCKIDGSELEEVLEGFVFAS